MSPVFTLILALLLTLVIEVPLGFLILKSKNAIFPLTLINVLSNPALNMALMMLFALTQSYMLYWIAVIIGEIAVFVGEGFLIRALCDIPIKRALLFSTIINAVSMLLGSTILALL